MSELVNELGTGWMVTGNHNEYLVSHYKSITVATVTHDTGVVTIKQNPLLGSGIGSKIPPTAAADLLKGWLNRD